MLIDAGNNEDGQMLVNTFKSMGITKIDYLIGTHPHEDHIGGLDNIIKNFDIGEIYMPEKSSDSMTFEDILVEPETIETVDIPIVTHDDWTRLSHEQRYESVYDALKKYFK